MTRRTKAKPFAFPVRQEASLGLAFFMSAIKLAQPLHSIKYATRSTRRASGNTPSFRGPWYRQAGDSPFLFRCYMQQLLRAQADHQPPTSTLRCAVPLATQRTGCDKVHQQPSLTTQNPPIDVSTVQWQLALTRTSLSIKTHHQRTMHVLGSHLWLSVKHQLQPIGGDLNVIKHDRSWVLETADHHAHKKKEQRNRS